MARIPVVSPGSTQLTAPKLTTQSPSALQTQPIGAGRGLAVLGQDIEKSASFMYQKMDEARRYVEKSKYEVYRTQTMAALRLAEDQERNPDGSLKTDTDISSFNEKLKKAKEGYKSIFTTKDGQLEADADWDKNAIIVSNDVLKNRYKNIISVGITADDVKIDNFTNAYAIDSDPANLKMIEGIIKEGEVRGFYTPEEAYKKKNEKIMGAIEWAIYNDTSTREEQSIILAKLKDKENPIYEGLAGEAVLDLIKKSQQRIFQNNQTFKRGIEISQNERNNAFIDKLASGTATFKDIDAEFAIPESEGGMKRSILDQYQRRLQVGITKDLNQMIAEGGKSDPTPRAIKVKEFNTLIDMFLDDESDRWKAKEALAKGYADGNLDEVELKVLNPLKDDLNDIKFNKSRIPLIKDKIRGIKNWWRGLYGGNPIESSEQEAINIKQLLHGVAKGEDPEVVTKQIMDSNMRKFFPDYTTYPKEGKIKLDRASGRQYKVFPDGNWAWITPKKEVK